MQGAYLAVARLKKPHGLKGEVIVIPLTDDPDEVFAEGNVLTPVTGECEPSGPELVIERSRPYHRAWLLKFRHIDGREAVEELDAMVLGAPAASLKPPGENEIYVHEIPGAKVVAFGKTIGVARELLRVPGGELLQVEVEGREHLIPFRKPFLGKIDRVERTIEIVPPEGLLEL